MGQRQVADKIGTLTGGTSITLGASTLTIGGQQYRNTSSISRLISTDVTLVANGLYMIYAVNNLGNIELRISSNVNSVGPSGFLSWKLVGAFYANGVTGSIAFGSFVNIEGAPTSDWITWTPTGTWTTGTWTGRKMRNGPNMHYEAGINLSSAPSGNWAMNLQESMDSARLPSPLLQTYINLGSMSCLAAGNAHGALEVGYNNATQVSGWTMLQTAGAGHNYTNVGPTAPMTFQAGDFVQCTFIVPIVGFDNKQLKDL